MAKVKKEKLSLEELLELALVKEEDRPYEVSGNWVWTRLENISEFNQGIQISVENQYKEFIDGRIRFIRIVDYTQGTDDIRYITLPSQKINSFVNHNDIVMVRYGATAGFLGTGISGVIANNMFKITPNKNGILKKYLYIYLKSPQIYNLLNSSGGSTAMPAINFKLVSNINIPLPPLEEQQRIVQVIESLFEKLDTAKELVKNALDSFENRKAAILHKAFTGELTAKWREENRVSFDEWEDMKMKNLTLLVTKGASPRWQGVNYIDDDSQTLFVTSENVREGFIDLQKEKYLENKINDIQKRSVLQMGDILLNIVGASIGRAAIFKINKLANINQAVCLIRLKDNVSNEFICNYLNSPSAMQYYSTNKVDVARANLSLTDVNNMSLLLPTIEEQKEIVRILDNLLDNEQRAKEFCDVIEKIDLMKKAILSRAFRGELGTNNPEEESAVELLKEVLMEKV